eukprot:TRINITY_DN2956_c0_g1_i3.p1 TRINITY_DN2956_c0_g1~~TRINITY_DN2956_c0_g1_i3.p1  ORF type:complete len:342 (-),score=106.87 TRINITY_DN2956_c0_g1_i3:215-1240(-)
MCIRDRYMGIDLSPDSPEDSLKYLDEFDAEDLEREQFLISSFDIVLNQSTPATEDQGYFVFLVDPFFGIHVLNITVVSTPFFRQVFHYNMYVGLKDQLVRGNVDFLGIEVLGPVGADSSEWNLLLTTVNHNHFEINLHLTLSALKVLQVYQRYGALTTANRLRVSTDYIALYAYQGTNQVQAKTSSILLYRRATDTKLEAGDGIVYKNIFSARVYNVSRDFLGSINFELADFSIDGQAKPIFYVSDVESEYNLAVYDINEKATVVIKDRNLKSGKFDLVAFNDFGTQRATIKINGKGWFKRNLLWIIIAITVLILILAIGIGCKVCNKSAEEPKKGLLDDP